jgi:hypothetical protein
MMRTILKAQELICYSITDPTLHWTYGWQFLLHHPHISGEIYLPMHLTKRELCK